MGTLRPEHLTEYELRSAWEWPMPSLFCFTGSRQNNCLWKEWALENISFIIIVTTLINICRQCFGGIARSLINVYRTQGSLLYVWLVSYSFAAWQHSGRPCAVLWQLRFTSLAASVCFRHSYPGHDCGRAAVHIHTLYFLMEPWQNGVQAAAEFSSITWSCENMNISYLSLTATLKPMSCTHCSTTKHSSCACHKEHFPTMHLNSEYLPRHLTKDGLIEFCEILELVNCI